MSGVALPRLVRFTEPGKNFDDGVEIKIRERAINPSFPEGAFASRRPPATRSSSRLAARPTERRLHDCCMSYPKLAMAPTVAPTART